MSDSTIQSRSLQRNPYTHQAHRAQFLWQILLPLFLFLILILGGSAVIVLAPAERTSKWADTSLILMILMAMILLSIFVVLTFALVYGVRQVLKFLPNKFFLTQEFFYRVERQVAAVSNAILEPILRIRSSVEGARVLGRRLTRK